MTALHPLLMRADFRVSAASIISSRHGQDRHRHSTVHINISEVARETRVEPKGFWEEVKEEFGDSLYDMGRSARNFAIWFLGSLPYLILWAVVIAVIVAGVWLVRKKKRLKKILKEQPADFGTEEQGNSEK